MRPRGIKRLFAFPFRTRDDVRADIGEEFRFHLDMRTEELVRLGMREADSRAQALREFGDQKTGTVACARHDDRIERRRRVTQIIGELRQDAIVGLRLLGRSPGFAVVSILTLALGIGANTAIFSALDAVLLRPLPYPAPDRLVEVFETLENGNPNSVSGGAYLDWRQHQTQFVALALLNPVTYNLRGRGTPERLTGVEASHELLQVLGVTPLLGRGFLPEDDRPGGRHDVVILTEELWRSRLGGDPSILDSTIVLDEVPRTVIGVLPRGAWLFREGAFFVPAVLEPGTPRARRAPHWAMVFGRLKPGVSLSQADAELKAIKRQLASEYPKFKQQWNVSLRPLPELIAGPSRPSLLILLGAVALVLLIACANVANLLLARACHREQEIALRAALGATGGRIVRQVLTESLVLATLGGVAGLAIAYWGVRLLRYLIVDMIPGAPPPELDARVLAFSLLLIGVTGLLFGLFPALRARRPDVNDALKNGGKNATAGGRQRAQSTLVIAEVALTVVLLTSAGLLLRSLANTASVDPGFEPGRALAFDVSLPEATYDAPEKSLAYSTALLARLRALPGVDAAGTGMAVPFTSGGFGEYFRRPNGAEERDALLGRMDFVSPGYLEALGMRLISGRSLTDADNRLKGPSVTVISASTARAFFPDSKAIGDAIGQQLIVGGDTWQIVGIVADKVDLRLDAELRPFAYMPQAFNPGQFSVVVRTSLPPLELVNSVQRELRSLDAGVALANPRALDQAMTGSMMQRRIVLTLVGAFAAGALVLAAIGLYGVMAYSVVMRRREICIRMALGAVRHDVLRHVLHDGVRLVAVGLAIGIAGALGVTQLLTSQLYQVRSYDPLVILGTMASVAGIALFACWMPAWRATRFDPIAALRND
jgi:predicted permease